MFAVLMAGGVGTRFWPMSRKAYPKQLLNFSGTKSMLQKTYDRIKPLTTNDKILVITTAELKKAVEKQLPLVPKENIIGEPEGKNTAPCIGLAATIIEKKASENQSLLLIRNYQPPLVNLIEPYTPIYIILFMKKQPGFY